MSVVWEAGDGGADALLDGLELGVQAAHVGEVLRRQSLTFRRNQVASDVDAVNELGAVSCADPDRGATRGEFAQHHMQPTGGLGAQRHEIMVTVSEEP